MGRTIFSDPTLLIKRAANGGMVITTSASHIREAFQNVFIRSFVRWSTIIPVVIFGLVIRFGYNGPFYPEISLMSDEDFTLHVGSYWSMFVADVLLVVYLLIVARKYFDVDIISIGIRDVLSDPMVRYLIVVTTVHCLQILYVSQMDFVVIIGNLGINPTIL